jgi:hypothetical protein
MSSANQIIDSLYENHLSDLTATVKAELIALLSKDLKKELKSSTKTKREPKLDEEGNVVKKPLNAGMVLWREFYTHLQTRLIDLTGNDKVSLKECICVGSILKSGGHYPQENLTDEVALEEYNAYIALTPEERKEKVAQAKTASTATSEADASDSEKPKKTKAKKAVAPEPVEEKEEKPKAQPKKKAEPVVEAKPVVAAAVEKKPVAKKGKKD